jgi:transmembrane sensor
MSVNAERVRNLIAQEAADWFVANREGLTFKERHTFATWINASPLHVEEYLALSAIACDLREACEASQDDIEGLVARARLDEVSPVQPLWRRLAERVRGTGANLWPAPAFALAVFALLSVGLLMWWNGRSSAHLREPDQIAALHFETAHGEQRTYRLSDHSLLHLNTDSAVAVRYDGKERLVELISGEAEFAVAPEPARPFRVVAGSVETRVIGTEFNVRRAPDSTVVTVVEGRVAVGSSSGANPAAFVQVGAGQQIRVAGGDLPDPPQAVDPRKATAWIHRQIVFEREPLERVAGEFNRYSSKPIEIMTPGLRSLEISGVFATDDTEAFLAFLRSLEGVRVEVTATQIRVSQN